MNIEIFPLEKVVFDGSSVCLGMERSAVENAIGTGQPIGKRYYYYNSELAIDYNENDTVEFIEFLGGAEGLLQPTIYGVSGFGTDAEKVAELFGIPTEDNEDLAADMRRANHWATIGVGVVGYYQR